MMALAKRIRDQRYAKGWGPDELAERARISRTALYQIECGKTETPRAATLNRIAEALGLPIDALLEGASPISRSGTAMRDGREPARRVGSGTSRINGRSASTPYASTVRHRELEGKLRELLHSPLGESLARIIDDAHRLLAGPGDRQVI
jgi:transcriptional regulator with XRE-family HTH domain